MIQLILTIVLIVVIVGIAVTSCGVNPDKAQATLSAMGMTDIQIAGYAFFGCGQEDAYRSKFTAKAANGQAISGVLCGGPFKGLTVRFD